MTPSRWRATKRIVDRGARRRSFSAGVAEELKTAIVSLDQLVDQLLVDREEEVLLLADVVVQARLADPHLVRDLGHRRGVVPALAEHARRGVDDVLADRGGAVLAVGSTPRLVLDVDLPARSAVAGSVRFTLRLPTGRSVGWPYGERGGTVG